MKRFYTGLFLLLFSFCAIAADNAVPGDDDSNVPVIRPAITMHSIMPLISGEKSGDEIYLGVTEYHSNGRSKHYTVPQSPVYWPSKGLHQIKDLQLWQGKLKSGDSAEVVISVIERDIPPWNMDDLIGTLKVKMRNDDGKLIYEWYQGDEKTPRSSPNQNYRFQGEDGSYKASFGIKLVKDTKAQPAPKE